MPRRNIKVTAGAPGQLSGLNLKKKKIYPLKKSKNKNKSDGRLFP